MPSSGLSGPFDLTESNILTYVPPRRIGTYMLGMIDRRSKTFLVAYTGRSDTDLAARLRGWVGLYSQFKFGLSRYAEDAFDKECRLYHDFAPPDTKLHPASPRGSNAQCPICSIRVPAFANIFLVDSM